jgi:acetyl-CoA carboxylase biotin carboxyl carrier protein
MLESGGEKRAGALATPFGEVGTAPSGRIAMKVSHQDIREILSIVEASSFDAIEIKVGDVQISASKSGGLSRAKPADTTPAPRPAPAATSTAAPQEPQAEPAPDKEKGLVEITAPIVGTFYVAPEPGAAPFVSPGERLAPDTTVGIIEVMKVFNDVRAEVTGEVVRCLVEDGDLVEFRQPIFLVRPEA